MLTWQAYIDRCLMFESDGVQLASAAIIGHNGAVWAQSANFPQFKVKEIVEVMEAFEEPGKLAQKGLRIGGTKYTFIQGNQRDVISGQKGTRGIAVKKTNQALVVGIHDERLGLAHCIEMVDSTANLLIAEDY